MQQIDFGDCLARLLRQSDVRPRDLARALGFEDATVIYRWLRNERVPKLDSGYLDLISATLALSAEQREALRQAQTASLERHLPRRYARTQDGVVGESLAQLLDRSRTVPMPPGEAALPQTSGVRRDAPLHATVILGRERIIEQLAELIEEAAKVANPGGDELLLTAQGRYLRDAEPQVQHRLIRAFHQAAERGWTISHLWRLDDRTERTIGLLEMMLNLVGSRRYLPHYIRPYGLLSPPYELAIVPGVAAMMMFGSGTVESVDTAFVVTEPSLVESLQAHFLGLREQAQLVFETYMSGRNEMAVSGVLAASEAQPGGRLSVKEGLSAITTPPAWLEEHSYFADSAVRSGRVTTEQVAGFLAFTRSRVEDFERQVSTYDYLDIVPQRAIRAIVTSGAYDLDSPLVGATVPIPLRIEHLQRTVVLLRAHPRYRLALLDESDERAVPPSPQHNVTGANNVMLCAWTLNGAGKPVTADLLITEPALVAAFREHFHAQWRKIAPRNRDKRHVIQWLERQVAALEQEQEQGEER